jgi:uncharacterized membrane protein YhdT
MVFLLVWLVVSFIVGVAAQSRGRDGSGWFLLSCLISPLLALLLLLVFPSRASEIELRKNIKIDDRELRKNIRRGRHEPRF